jgi:hypothetical protein
LKRIVSSLILIFWLIVLTGCTYKSAAVEFGKYYLENSNDAYIEIISETKIVFVNVKFPEVEAGLLDVFGELNVAEMLASTYDFAENDYLYVEILDLELDGEPYSMALRLNYSRTDKAISTTDQVFFFFL